MRPLAELARRRFLVDETACRRSRLGRVMLYRPEPVFTREPCCLIELQKEAPFIRVGQRGAKSSGSASRCEEGRSLAAAGRLG